MKKIWKYSCVLLAGLALTVACSKETAPSADENVLDPSEQTESGQPQKMVTITVTMPEDGLTRVAFEQDPENPDGAVKLTWEEMDKISVNGEEFTLVSGAGTQTAGFSGPEVTAESYTIAYNGGEFGATQHQDADADTDHLAYTVSLADVSTYQDVEFTQAWATAHGGGTLTQSSIFRLRAQMPAGVAEDVVAVKIVAKDADDEAVNIFGGGNELTVMIDAAGDAGNDGILDIYANLPTTAATIPAGTAFFVRFMTTARGGVYSYTRYHVFTSALELTPGKVNALKLNCTATDKHAGNKTVCDGTTAAKAYLIGDAYQLIAVQGLAIEGSTTSFKMIDDIDMDGLASKYTPVNTSVSGYTKVVDFNGNHKTVSNLGKHLFYVFKGSIYDLTLDHSSVTTRGIFAEYIQGSGHSITNVTVSNGTLETTAEKTGGLVGNINSGTEGVTSVTITGCSVVNTSVKVSGSKGNVGGLIGICDGKVEISGCTVSKTDSGTASVEGTSSNTGGLIGDMTTNSNVSTITNCTVSGVNVTGTGVVGGLVGFANAKVNISGCTYTGGTVTCSGQYIGGFVGSTGNFDSTITDCQVENAIINVNGTADPRGGGFIGLEQDKVIISGCTVGSSSEKVTINTKQPTQTDNKYNVINVGGFVGVCYGKITKNGDVRSKAYVKITTNNTVGTPLKLGGFVGFHAGNIEYSDAFVDMTNLKGQHIGGFAGYVTKNNATRVGAIDNCAADGSVTGNNYTGGFIGYLDANGPNISNSSASGSVSGQSGSGGFVGQTMSGIFTNCTTSATCTFSGSNNGGFVGQIHNGTMTGCSASGNVTATGGSTLGGFFGLITNNGTTLEKCSASGNVVGSSSYNGGFGGIIEKGTSLIKRCYASGNITSNQTYAAGFIGNIHHASNAITVTIENCYATGDIINSNQIRGGFIAQVGTVTSATITNCYASGNVVGSFRLGGLIGNIGSASITVEHCSAWNGSVTASSVGASNWSSGAVVGTAFPSCKLTDNYRRLDIALKAFWGNVSGFTYELTADYNHPNVDGASSSTYLVVRDKSTGAFGVSTTATLSGGNYPIFPYHGKVEAGKTLSQLASTTLGWSGDVWDFTGDLPTLK